MVLLRELAGSTGLEPAASGVTGRRSNQLNYDPDRTITIIGEFVTCEFNSHSRQFANARRQSGRYRTRTCDSRRVKPVLYQLS